MRTRHGLVSLVVAAFAASPLMVEAQPVLLQIRPHVGDTLIVRLDQRVDMSGAPVGCGLPTGSRGRRPSPPAGCAEASRRLTTVSEVFSRAIVKSVAREGAVVLTITDSIRTASSRGTMVGKPRRVRGREGSMELRVSSEGGAEVIDSDASEQLRALFGQMPATLSDKPVAVGGQWKREMRIPIAGEAGAMSLVRATFRLDSLGRNGDIAYISMRGTLSHDHRDGSDSELEGLMTGSMQLDRRLSWITDTRAEIDVTSLVRLSPGADPMRVRTKVIQTLRAAPAR